MAKKQKTKAEDHATWTLNVKSSNLERVKYKPYSCRLFVEFKSGAQYVYSDVTLEEFYELSVAESAGSWFSENIKDEKACRKME